MLAAKSRNFTSQLFGIFKQQILCHIFLLSHPNHAEGVYGIRNLLRYGIATKSRMESSRRKYTFGDAIRLRRCHTRWRVIPCQACGLDKKITSERCSDVIFFGDPWENRTPVTAVKGRCLSRLTNGPMVAEIGLEPMTYRV